MYNENPDVISVNIFEWVEKAKNDPIRYFERQATEVVLTAIGMTESFSEHVFLKGGILMGIVYQSERNTGDVDFTTDLEPDNAILEELEKELNSAFPRAAAELGYPDLLCNVQSKKVRPNKHSLSEDSYPAIRINVGYARRGTPGEKHFQKGKAITVIQMDISFNEPVQGIQIVKLDADRAAKIHAYSITDLLAEKFRALLQQPQKRKNRRQDVYDINLLVENFSFDEGEKKLLLQSFQQKCMARKIIPTRESMSSLEIKELAGAEWATLSLEIGEESLPNFDECYEMVESFYKSLPW